MDEKIDILFQYNPESEFKTIKQLPIGCKLIRFTPSFLDLLKKRCSMSEYLWSIITAKNYVLFIVKNQDNDIIHKSARIGKCYKLNFLNKDEYEIGPCYTTKSWRGKGIYPFVLKQIISDVPMANYYMFVDEKNLSSIRGVEKAGFTAIGKIKRCSNGVWRKI